MKVLHVTNTISPHQLPLARHLAEIVGVENFRFGATQPPIIERVKLGWNVDEDEAWILHAGEVDNDRIELEHWWDEADVVICGDRLFERMEDRLDKKKLTFYMSERWWKPPIGIGRMLHPRFALMAKNFIKISKSPSLHYLPIGLYAADDMKRIAKFSSRMWNWGYFTELPKHISVNERNCNNFSILWAGRMFGWKRVDTLIRAFAKLQAKCKNATLTLVGEGPERIRLENMAKQMLLKDSYRIYSSMPIFQVIELMKQNQIYVLSSSAFEGWGAVINEAMSVGCAVIASKDGGAARSMIEHEKNGLLFRAGDWRALATGLDMLSRNETMRRQLADEGQRTLTEYWSPAKAAKRFLDVSASLLARHPVPSYVKGPMAQYY